ncbi:hypothetical protein M758_7G034600 [Ceratodon purpureus]|nr:hypothetical protein M758_7G034600 [Ceratodon purpureus]
MINNGLPKAGLAEIRDSTDYELQEKGEIYFFYKPKAGVENPATKEDVQRLYIVLRPEEAEHRVEEKQSSDSGKEGKYKAKEEDVEFHKTHKIDQNAPHQLRPRGGDMEVEQDVEVRSVVTEDLQEYTVHGGLKITNEHMHRKFVPYKGVAEGGHGTERVEIGKKPLFRYMVMGRKHLPLPHHTSPFWGYVELVTTNPADIRKVLTDEDTESDTPAHGEKSNPIARPVGEGVYSLVRHHTATRTSTHLVYKLEHPGPHKKHEPQDALHIEPQASFVLQIKNPEQPGPAVSTGIGSKRRAYLPAHLQGKIGSRRFMPADPPDLLNYEGVEFILLSAHDDIDSELGNELRSHGHDPLTMEVPDLIEYLAVGPRHHKHLIRPLIEGQWA